MENISLSILIAQVINFAVIFFLFKKFLGDKIVSEIESRRKALQEAKEATQEADSKLADAEKEADAILEEARAKSRDMISDASEMATKKSDDILAKAEEEAKNKLDASLREVEKERLVMIDGIRAKASSLALRLNAKLFKNENANKDFLEKEIEAIKM